MDVIHLKSIPLDGEGSIPFDEDYRKFIWLLLTSLDEARAEIHQLRLDLAESKRSVS